jgi:hypothetical protein
MRSFGGKGYPTRRMFRSPSHASLYLGHNAPRKKKAKRVTASAKKKIFTEVGARNADILSF